MFTNIPGLISSAFSELEKVGRFLTQPLSLDEEAGTGGLCDLCVNLEMGLANGLV